MALQSSGQITIQDIVNEFSGTAPHGLKEYYGVAAGIPASGEISIKDFYGAAAVTYLDYQTVTVGYAPGSQYAPAFYGYFSPNIGSVSDGTSNLYGGATILGLYWISYNALYFLVSGNRANSGWSTMTVSGQTFNRVDATYSYSSGNDETSWVWGSVTTNPYTPEGANIGVEFN